jgi:hypothetical protein
MADNPIPLSPPEVIQLAEIIRIQLDLSQRTGSEQTITLIFRNGHLSFLNASNNRKAIPPHAMMDDQYQWHEV